MFEENNWSIYKMMNVDIMSEIVEAFDNGEPTIGDFIIEKWSHNKGSVRMRRASANFIYEFKNNQQQFILRIAPETERTKQQILAELDFMLHLKNNEFPVPDIIPSINDNLVEELITEKRSYFGVVFQKCPGIHYELNNLSNDLFLEWGRLTALIHKHSQTYEPKLNRKRRSWAVDIKSTLNWLPENEFQLKEILLDLVEKINSFPKNENYGLIHFDLELDNILWNDKHYFVIDFDDAAYYHYIADIAFALEEIREEKTNFRQQLLGDFIKGYKKIKTLPANWNEQLECYFLLLDVLKYARTLHAYDNTNPENYPEWLTELHERHMNSLNETRKKLIKKWNL
ncbi:MAG: phosphotransferase [Asgard group archaeon]|nr:phosphotransferase [Asgard group archaeon]